MAVFPMVLPFDMPESSVIKNDGTVGDLSYVGSSGTWGKVDVSDELPFGLLYNTATVGCNHGDGSYIYPSTSDDYVSSEWEIGGWVKLTGTGDGILYTGFAKNDSFYRGFQVDLLSNGIIVRIGSHSQEDYIEVSSLIAHNIVANEVAHISVHYSGSTKVATVRKNNEIVGTWQGSHTFRVLDASWSTRRLLLNNSSHFHWITGIYYASGSVSNSERLEKMGYIPAIGINIISNITNDAYLIPRSYIDVKSTISTNATGDTRTLLDVKSTLKTDGELNCEFLYRLEKGTPLSDMEIRRNLIGCNMKSTYTPVAEDGKIINHITGCKYLGDVTVDDADGSYVGSGKCFAFLEGYSLSEMAILP